MLRPFTIDRACRGACCSRRHWRRLGSMVRSQTARDPVSFSNDIQPILNQNCVQCHGGVRQKNGVSFVFREDALGKGKSGRRTIVPGHPDESELIARMTSSDPETRMPYHAAATSSAAN